jgi:hypothetical protein
LWYIAFVKELGVGIANNCQRIRVTAAGFHQRSNMVVALTDDLFSHGTIKI